MGLLGEFEHIDDDMMVTISKQMLRELVEEGVNKQLNEIQYRLENFIQRHMVNHSNDIVALKVEYNILQGKIDKMVNTLAVWEPTMNEIMKDCFPQSPPKFS